MRLRMLCESDAPLMLEWMHDENVIKGLQADFASKTIDDCRSFIASAQSREESLHLAIADEADTYMGTVSLKHIHDGMAEFAIAMRSAAMGRGFARFGMRAILEHGIKKCGLAQIYWCVLPDNHRAVRFYDKNGYVRTEDVPDCLRKRYDDTMIWYMYG